MKKYNLTVQGNPYEVEVVSYTGSTAEVVVNGEAYSVEIAQDATAPKTATPKAAPKAAAKGSGSGSVVAPIPGTILKVVVKEGDTVAVGQDVIILEAMKMENNIKAEKAGTVKSVKVKAGDTVLEGDALLEIA